MNRNAIVSYAILKVDMDERDVEYIDYYIPFVRKAIEAHGQSGVSDFDVKKYLVEEFGINIPQKVALMMLRRLRRDGELDRKNNLYFISKDFVSNGFNERSKKGAEYADALIQDILCYASQIGFTLDEDGAWKCLSSFLSAYGYECLSSYLKSQDMPTIEGDTGCNAFVAGYVHDRHSKGKECIAPFIEIVKSQMLSVAIFCKDMEDSPEKFSGVTFYLDTRIVLNALGLHGPVCEDAFKELFSLVSSLGGKFAVFRHTVDEIIGILNYCFSTYKDLSVRNDVLDELRRKRIGKTEIVIIQDNLENLISTDLGIPIENSPKIVAQEMISEVDLSYLIESKTNGQSKNARETDVKSIRSIYQLRKMKPVLKLEQSIATFVTTNTSLVEAAKDYDAVEFGHKRVSAAITEYALANFAWIKSPSLASSSLPLREILAFAKAALQPSERFWAAYVDAIETAREDGRITSENYTSLRYSPWAREELMITTMGLQSRLNDTSLGSILEQVSRPTGSEEISRLNEIMNTTELEKDELKRERDEAVSIANQNKQRADAAEIENECQRLENFCNCVSVVDRAKTVASWKASLSVSIFIVLCIISFYIQFTRVDENYKIIIGLFFLITTTVLGWNASSVYNKMHQFFARKYCKQHLICVLSESEIDSHIAEFYINKQTCDSRRLTIK